MYALVDVETTGLSRYSDRVVQIAVRQLNQDGTHHDWSTLVDPGRDPGPTHLHGISAAHLEGAPTFDQVAGQVADLVQGRVVVAHNASFDWSFISQECARTTVRPAAEYRLCTLAMARRLDLPLPDLKLGTLARWAGVAQVRWHDARDDVATLHGIFHRLWIASAEAGLPLPYTRNSGPEIAPPTVRAPKVDSPWVAPSTWSVGSPLVQGLRYCITGGTSAAREVLYNRSIRVDLVPMNAVSGKTALVVSNAPHLETVKLRRARELGVPVIDEPTFERLLLDVRPGTAKGQRQSTPRATAPSGPISGRRVLVVGGTHDRQADVRTRIAAQGGRCAVNLTPTVNAVVLLDGWDRDARAARLTDLPRLHDHTLEPVVVADPAVVEDLSEEPVLLARGQVVDLPDLSSCHLFLSWPLKEPPFEVDAVAMLVDRDDRALSDHHLAFFNAPETPGGAVRVDVTTDGEADIDLELDDLSGLGQKVMVAACVGDGRTFGDVGPIEFVVRDADGRPLARSVLDAATVERSLVVAEFYQRGTQWRIRAVGQGMRTRWRSSSPGTESLSTDRPAQDTVRKAVAVQARMGRWTPGHRSRNTSAGTDWT